MAKQPLLMWIMYESLRGKEVMLYEVADLRPYCTGELEV